MFQRKIHFSLCSTHRVHKGHSTEILRHSKFWKISLFITPFSPLTPPPEPSHLLCSVCSILFFISPSSSLTPPLFQLLFGFIQHGKKFLTVVARRWYLLFSHRLSYSFVQLVVIYVQSLIFTLCYCSMIGYSLCWKMCNLFFGKPKCSKLTWLFIYATVIICISSLLDQCWISYVRWQHISSYYCLVNDNALLNLFRKTH